MVVSSLKQLYGLHYIYCWHGLSAYWSGVSPDPNERDVAKYNASLHYSQVSSTVYYNLNILVMCYMNAPCMSDCLIAVPHVSELIKSCFCERLQELAMWL